jgi:CHAT domain-containing protein
MVDDRVRRAALALLDEATAQDNRSANSQARRLESLASLYDPGITDVPITLRRTSLDLQIASPEASPSSIGESLGCLVRDLTLQGNKALVNPLMIEVQKRMAEARGAKAAQQTFDAAESIARSEAPELPSIEILEQRTAGLGDPSGDDRRRRLIDIVQELRHYKAARNDKARVHSLWERLTAIAVQGSSSPGALAGLVYSANAEHELLFGSSSDANKLIAKAIPTVDSPEWRESDVMVDAWGALLKLRNFSTRISENEGQLQEALAKLKDIETQSDKSPGAVAEALVSVITAAISDYDYATVLTSFDRLSKLKIGFFDPGFMTRDNLEQHLSDLAFSCQSNGVTESVAGDTWVGINECATTAIRMTALIAEDELQKIATSSESEDRTRSRQQQNTTLREIVTDIGPLVNQVDDVGDELGTILRWLVAIRTPPIAGAELERVESLRPAGGSEEFQRRLDDWRRVGGGWLQAESRYRCAQLSSLPPSNLQTLAQAAESARNSTRSAWAALTGTLPDGALILPYNELKVEELKASLSAEEAILSYAVVDKEILIWVVRRDGVSLRLSDAGRLNENIESLLGAINRPPTFVGQTLDLGPAQRVYNQLIGPVADLLADVQSLFVDGDEITTRVPFSALVPGGTVSAEWSPSAGWTPEWLGKRFSISLLPSLASFAQGRFVPARPSGEILAAGDPVRIGVPVDPSAWCQMIVTGASGQPAPPLTPAPGADAELQAVMRLAGPRGYLLSAERFSSAELRPASFARFGMMIFATHGEQETATYPAGLVLSGSGPEKNRLTSEDLPSLSINADIVVLSACDSGMANGRGGFNSLMAGFVRAGARQVIATGWTTGTDVQAITASLVQQYVVVGARNMDRVLQSAVKAMMFEEAKRQLRHPFFWAGIFLLGSSVR